MNKRVWCGALLGVIVSLMASRPAAADSFGPVPMLVGAWESQGRPGDTHQLQISWNPSARRYEGVLVRQSFGTQQAGFALGELVWVSTPTSNPNVLEVQGEWRRGAQVQWRRGIVRLDRSSPALLVTTLGAFRRVGGPPMVAAGPPMPPPAPAAAPPPSAMPPSQMPAPAAAPPAPAAAPYATPPPSAPPLASNNFGGFPSVDEVLARVTGSDPPDTASRQFAAFKALHKILNELRSRDQNERRAVTDLMKGYWSAQNQSRRQMRGGTNMGAPYVDNFGFRETLIRQTFPAVGKFLDDRQRAQDQAREQAAAAVQAAEEKKRVAAEEAAQKRAAREAEEAKAEEIASRPVLASLETDKKNAKTKGVDMSVFGIPLGEPLKLPKCPPQSTGGMMMMGLTGIGAGGAETCQGDETGDLAQGLAALVVAMATQSTKHPEATKFFKTTTVRLAASKCPGWVQVSGTCLVFLTLQSGVVLSGYVATGDEHLEEDILKNLKKKYHREPTSHPFTMTCTNQFGRERKAKAREWDMAGLHVTYTPISEDCVHGKINIETQTAHKLLESAKQESEEAEPKL